MLRDRARLTTLFAPLPTPLPTGIARALQDAGPSAGPALEDPGLGPWVPAVAFLVLAAVTWAIWRKLAD